MSDVSIKFNLDEDKTEHGAVVNRQYPKDVSDLFAGEQLVIVGRYKKSGAAKVTVIGKVGKKEVSLDFPAKLVEKSADDSSGFVEKLWAMRRIGEIMDQLDLKGKNEELVKELVSLSTKHGILTPYTSFLADENTNLRDVTVNAREADRRLASFAETEGAAGVQQRMLKNAFAQQAQAPATADAAYEFKGGAAKNIAPGAIASSPSPAGGPNATTSGFGGRGAQGGSSNFGLITRDEKAGQAEQSAIAQSVRNVGQKTFYKRNNQWVDSAASEKQEKEPKRSRGSARSTSNSWTRTAETSPSTWPWMSRCSLSSTASRTWFNNAAC